MGSGKSGGEGGLGAGLVSGIAAGGVFLLFWLVLGLPFAVSLGAGILSMGGALAIAKGLGTTGARAGEAAVGEYVDKDLAKKVVEDAKTAAAGLLASCEAMEAGSVRSKFRKLAEGLGKIGADVALDPRDAVAASIFLTNNGDAAIRMARIYLRLRKDGQAQDGNQATLAKLDGVLDRMVKAAELELTKLQADEWDELRMEIDLMEGDEAGGQDGPGGQGSPKGMAI